MGAAERTLWSSFARQKERLKLVSALTSPSTLGVVVSGPWGAGKTTLARALEADLSQKTLVVRLFGTHSESLIPYGSMALHVARLPASAAESPSSIIRGIEELFRQDADGREILLIIDDLPGFDALATAVVMHLLLSRTAKALVLVRKAGDLPEDFVSLAKDGLLGELRIDYLSRVEVGELIARATGNFVSESAVEALYSASDGIPLVVQTLFTEQAAKGTLELRQGVWIISASLALDSQSLLADMVHSKLARESEQVRLGVEKMALLSVAPLSVVRSVLGPQTFLEVDDCGYLEIGADGQRLTRLRERYLGAVVRATLSPERMAEMFPDIANDLGSELETLGPREVMSLAAWSLDAGLAMEPRFGLLAARHAVQHFDPLLALRCTTQLPFIPSQSFEAAQTRSTAFRIMGEYQQALQELESVGVDKIRELAAEHYASWVLLMCGLLLRFPHGHRRVSALLTEADARLSRQERKNSREETRKARQVIRLAYLELKVHRGEFADVVDELEDSSGHLDSELEINHACLLVQTLAVLGREVEAVDLGHRIHRAVESLGMCPQFMDYSRDGLANAMLWSGQWFDCVDMLRRELEQVPQEYPLLGGTVELKLGIAYAYAGRGSEAVNILVSAVAQLEVCENNNCLPLAYAAMAVAHAQQGQEEETLKYLAFADCADTAAAWINRAMTQLFRLTALQWLEDPGAGESLYESALNEIAKGRYATASMMLFTGSIRGTSREYDLLEEISLRRQGALASLIVGLSRSWRERSAAKALEAATMAASLELVAVESRCAALALDFALDKGQKRLAQDARRLLKALEGSVTRLPLDVHGQGARLTHREQQVGSLAKRGLTNRAIAERMGISIRTVEGHLYQVYIKLSITTRQELEQGQGR